MNAIRILLAYVLFTNAVTLNAMELPTHNTEESAWSLLTDSALTQIAAQCNSRSRNALMHVSKALNFFASPKNKDILYQNPVNLSKKDEKRYLITGCLQGKYNLVKNLLDNGANPDTRERIIDRTPLICAKQNNHIAIVNLLNEYDAFDQQELDGITPSPFMYAIYMGDIEAIKDYLAQDESLINIPLENGITPLQIAVWSNNKELVALLLTYDTIQANTKDISDCTALHSAMLDNQDDRTDIVAQLLAHGKIPLDTRSKNGFTALHIAAKNGLLNKFKLLLRMQDNILHNDSDTDFWHAARESHNDKDIAFWLATKEGHADIIKVLPFVDYNQKDENGDTPLHIAADQGFLDIVTTLLTPSYTQVEGANALLKRSDIQVNATTPEGDTPLHYAALKGHVNIVEALLAHPNTLVNIPNNRGDTPLHLAIINPAAMHYGLAIKAVKTVTILLDHPNIDINKPNSKGFTPLHLAVINNNIPLTKLLLAQDYINVNAKGPEDITPLYLAIHYNYVDILNLLLAHENIQLNEQSYGFTPLHVAAAIGTMDIVATLLACPNIQHLPSPDNSLPLDIAIRHGNTQAVELLLAQENARALLDGDSLLHFIAMAGNVETLKFLFEHNYFQDVNKKRDDITALEMVCLTGVVDQAGIVKTLISYGADVNATTNGRTILWAVNDILKNGKPTFFGFDPLTEDEYAAYLEIKALLLLAGAKE